VSLLEYICDLKHQLCKLRDITDPENHRLVDYFNHQFYAVMKDNATLQLCNMQDYQEVLIDSKTKNGEREHQKQVVQYNYQHTYGMTNHYQRPALGPGKVGLSNMGTTCYFNSSVQCLLHTVPLIRQMLRDNWNSELNVTSPIGMKGKLATEFHDLAVTFWEGTASHVSPSELKSVIGEFADQFSGWEQQDSHELLTFILDGIHEDLNRCTQKPLIAPLFGNGNNDDEISSQA
jgi:ubiquitin carboxyl-terminal hydrolase 4/11/15